MALIICASYQGDLAAREQCIRSMLGRNGISNALLGIVHSMANKGRAAFSNGHSSRLCNAFTCRMCFIQCIDGRSRYQTSPAPWFAGYNDADLACAMQKIEAYNETLSIP
jgi:alcohol dehydrogenase class IV